MNPGDIIDDRYEVESVLGEGGMAIVYKAKDIITEKEVAIKIIREETMKNPLNLTRFEREARAAASLKHQNIVQVSNLGTFEGRPYMVTELVNGKTLREALCGSRQIFFLRSLRYHVSALFGCLLRASARRHPPRH
jgi:serine/threonine protein kinase